MARGEIEQDGGIAGGDAMFVVPRRGIDEPEIRALRTVVPLEVAEVLRVRPDVTDVQARTPAGMGHDQIRRVPLVLHFPPHACQRLPVEHRRFHEREVGVLLLADLAVGLVAHHPQPVRRRSLPAKCRRSRRDFAPTCTWRGFRTGPESCCAGTKRASGAILFRRTRGGWGQYPDDIIRAPRFHDRPARSHRISDIFGFEVAVVTRYGNGAVIDITGHGGVAFRHDTGALRFRKPPDRPCGIRAGASRFRRR